MGDGALVISYKLQLCLEFGFFPQFTQCCLPDGFVWVYLAARQFPVEAVVAVGFDEQDMQVFWTAEVNSCRPPFDEAGRHGLVSFLYTM